MPENKSIFELADKFEGLADSPLGNWLPKAANNNSSTILDVSIFGYWSSDLEGKHKITQAHLDDTVYYQLRTSGIPNGEQVLLNLFETDFPFGGKSMSRAERLNVQNNKANLRLYLNREWSSHISEDVGKEIELYWQVTYANTIYKLDLQVLHVEDIDEYILKIEDERYMYTCNCGWIDRDHAFTKTKRNRIDIGPDALWKQIKNETGTKSQWDHGYKVIYTQDAPVLGVFVGVTKEYFLKYGLSIEIKERIAMAILQEVSMEFEQKQALGYLIGKGDSSFEPADLVSNMLGLYSVIRPEYTPTVILNKCKKVGAAKSVALYKKYPGTFSLSEYRNKKFTPRFFENDFCENPTFPKEFQQIVPLPKDQGVYRDWLELFDVYKGIPPIKGPK